MRSIQHSGLTFIKLGESHGKAIWPIQEYLVRRKHSPKVAERIERLNYMGKPEGEAPRGWHPHERSRDMFHDHLTVKKFIAKYGRDKYWALPREAFTQRNGKRNRISWLWVKDHA